MKAGAMTGARGRAKRLTTKLLGEGRGGREEIYLLCLMGSRGGASIIMELSRAPWATLRMWKKTGRIEVGGKHIISRVQMHD